MRKSVFTSVADFRSIPTSARAHVQSVVGLFRERRTFVAVYSVWCVVSDIKWIKLDVGRRRRRCCAYSSFTESSINHSADAIGTIRVVKVRTRIEHRLHRDDKYITGGNQTRHITGTNTEKTSANTVFISA